MAGCELTALSRSRHSRSQTRSMRGEIKIEKLFEKTASRPVQRTRIEFRSHSKYWFGGLIDVGFENIFYAQCPSYKLQQLTCSRSRFYLSILGYLDHGFLPSYKSTNHSFPELRISSILRQSLLNVEVGFQQTSDQMGTPS